MAQEPSVSPWVVVAVQFVVGIVVALAAWGVTGRLEGFWSALYGAAVVVVPAALMARGMTSKLALSNPGVGAVSYMLWQGVKIAVSVAMLMVAPRIVDGLDVARAVGGPCRVHQGLLGGAVVAPPGNGTTEQTWPQKDTPPPPVNTSFTT